MRVNRQYILVRIDKAAQRQKREKVGDIYIAPNFAYMSHNLQYGEIMQIGEKAQKNYPDAKVGDIALFHHHIEGSYDDHAPEYILDTLPNGDELRLIDCTNTDKAYRIFGFIKSTGLVAAPEHVFINHMVTPVKKKYVSSILFNTGYEPTDDELRQKLDDLLGHQRVLDESLQSERDPDKSLQIVRGIEDIGRERERITQFLNADRFVTSKIVHINPRTASEHDIHVGDTVLVVENLLYPLDTMGNKHLTIRTDFIMGKIKKPHG